jgi:hypothetical protein
VDERYFLVLETNRENRRIYYRVKADGVEFPSLVCILSSLDREVLTTLSAIPLESAG